MPKQKKLIEEDIIPGQEGILKGESDDLIKIGDETELEQQECDYSGIDLRSLQTVVSYENEDYLHLSKLNDRIDGVFKNSRWIIINPSKKIPKDLIPLIFQDILKELENSEFTMVEKFVAICDYTAINYLKAYESIHMKYKELIVQEMDKKYQILAKRGIKKIF